MRTVGSLLMILTCVVVLGPLSFTQQANSATNNPLINLLQSKGILSPDEAAAVLQASSPEESNRRLVQLLVEKGLISQQEYQTTLANSATISQNAPLPQVVSAAYYSPQTPQNVPPRGEAA